MKVQCRDLFNISFTTAIWYVNISQINSRLSSWAHCTIASTRHIFVEANFTRNTGCIVRCIGVMTETTVNCNRKRYPFSNLVLKVFSSINYIVMIRQNKELYISTCLQLQSSALVLAVVGVVKLLAHIVHGSDELTELKYPIWHSEHWDVLLGFGSNPSPQIAANEWFSSE